MARVKRQISLSTNGVLSLRQERMSASNFMTNHFAQDGASHPHLGSTGKDPQAKKLTLSFLRTVHTRQDEYTVSVFAIYIFNRNRNLSLSLITVFLQPKLNHEQLLTPVPGVTALPTISPL